MGVGVVTFVGVCVATFIVILKPFCDELAGNGLDVEVITGDTTVEGICLDVKILGL